MSWSTSTTGTPEQCKAYLQEYGSTLTDQSKQEYDAALPHILGIVEQNFGNPGRHISVLAYGHGGERHQAEGSPQSYRECTVTVKEWDPKI